MASKLSISSNISKELKLPLNDSRKIVDAFIFQIIKNSKNSNVKIHSFGTFYKHETPKRLGRNPLTKESYIIESFKKLSFRASNKLKKQINLWEKKY